VKGRHVSQEYVRRHRRRQAAGAAIVVLAVVAAVTLYKVEQSPSRPVRISSAGVRGSRTGSAGGDSTPASTDSPTTVASTTTTVAPTTTTTNPNGATGLFDSPAVASYLAGRTGDITAALYNLSTSATSLYRPGNLEYTASIVKADILATLLYQEQQSHTGMSSADQELATTMIEQSDNDSATDLWNDIGQQNGVAAFNALIPMPSTTPGTEGYWGDTQTDPADQISLLRQLVQPSKILTAQSQQYELNLMENVEAGEDWGVSAGVPTGVTVALKNGWLPLVGDGDWQVNSIGWIDGAGHDYLLAVMTKGNASEGDGIATIEGLSQLVWSGT
jgi:hypothetical protein